MLYEHYSAAVDDIVGHAAGLRRYAQQVVLVGESVRWRVQQSSLFVDGSLETPLESVDGVVLKTAADIDEAARYAAAVLTRWATAIQVYDQGIDALNADVVRHCGVLSDAQRSEFDGRVQQLQADLDDEAAEVAGQLERGPNVNDWFALRRLGVAPGLVFINDYDPFLASALYKTGLPGGPAFLDGTMSSEERAAWWASLTPAEQVAVMTAYAAYLGGSNGIPAGVRDEANRIGLADTLARLEAQEADGTLTEDGAVELANARAVRDALASAQSRVDPMSRLPVTVQLLSFEPTFFAGDGRTAISIGDVDTADDVAFTVPGFSTEVAGSIQTQVDRSWAVYETARLDNAGGRSTATVAWVGYDAPSGDDSTAVAFDVAARAGAAWLAEDVAGMRAARPGSWPHVTVIGHSYGSTTTALAATEEHLPTDDIVLLGSPGAGEADDAYDLGIGSEHVFVGANSRDAVTQLGSEGWVTLGPRRLGTDPTEDDFGAVRFQAESPYRSGIGLEDHSRYWDPASESLANLAAIVNGNYDAVTAAGYRHDPVFGGVWDPEYFRDPTSR